MDVDPVQERTGYLGEVSAYLWRGAGANGALAVRVRFHPT